MGECREGSGGGRRTRRIAAVIAAAALGLATAACGAGGEGEGSRGALEEGLRAMIDSAGEEVSVMYHAVDGSDSLLITPDVRMHAASTMKVPVMIRLFLDRDSGLVDLDDSLEVRTAFRSIVDGSTYELTPESDSDTALYRRVGEEVAIGELVRRMIVVSSNLATNLLIDEAEPERVTALMRRLGADSIEVLRGVEDIPAYRAGLSNTTTARDLAAIFLALARGEAASRASTEAMLRILSGQEFDEKIPALLPEGARVAHKTGWITGISHDAGVVDPPDAPPYVLVALTRGFENEEEANRLVARISRRIYDYHVDRHGAGGA